jgi:hypothetical protein
MNWNAVGAIGEILGALAVFISLVYLASQIRANTLQSRASMAASITVEQSRLLESLGDPSLAKVAMKLVQGEVLDPVERFRFVAIMPGAKAQLKRIVAANHPSVGEVGVFRSLADFDSAQASSSG